jgi:hypothetical protein
MKTSFRAISNGSGIIWPCKRRRAYQKKYRRRRKFTKPCRRGSANPRPSASASPPSRCTARAAGAIGPVSVLAEGGQTKWRKVGSLLPKVTEETTTEAPTLLNPAGPCARRPADAADDASKVCDRRMAFAGGRRRVRGDAPVGPSSACRQASRAGRRARPLLSWRYAGACRGSPCGSTPLGTPLAAGGAIAHLPSVGPAQGLGGA